MIKFKRRRLYILKELISFVDHFDPEPVADTHDKKSLKSIVPGDVSLTPSLFNGSSCRVYLNSSTSNQSIRNEDQTMFTLTSLAFCNYFVFVFCSLAHYLLFFPNI